MAGRPPHGDRSQLVTGVPATEVPGRQGSEASHSLQRRGVRVLSRRSLRYRLRTAFYAISAICLLLAIWKAFTPPIAVILSVIVLVGGPLMFLVVSDLRQKRSLTRDRLALSNLEMPDVDQQLDAPSAAATSAQGTTSTAGRSLPTKDKEPKWWLRRWPNMRLGRFGIWH